MAFFYGVDLSPSGTSLYVPLSEAAWLIGPNGTSETSGGEVEHEVYMLQSIILLVVELKLALKDEMDHVAQVLLDLVCVIVYI